MTLLDSSINQKTDNALRLIVHIGAGKTGTTSIQRTLDIQQKELIEQGVWYLGLMLENAPVKHYQWQRAGDTIEELMSQREDVITTQMTDVLSASADMIISSGCKTAILSNESFFYRPKVHKAVICVFEQLAAKGWDILVIAYVRRHDAWLRSAYIQWGLKHKTYRGSLLPFSEWVKQFRIFLNDGLSPWVNAKGCKIIVRNYDATEDVVNDFYELAGITNKKVDSTRTNESPSPEELLLRALFNNQIEGIALPDEFNRLMNITGIDFNHSATTFLSEYLPSDQDLADVVQNCAEDREIINRILIDGGQQPLETSVLKSKPVETDLAKLTAIMFEIIANQARRIDILESEISKFTTSSGVIE